MAEEPANQPAEPPYAQEIRIALIVAGQVVQSINTARQRCEIGCSPLLVVSSIEDAGRMVAALSESLQRAHAAVWKAAAPALGLADAQPPARQPDVPTEFG